MQKKDIEMQEEEEGVNLMKKLSLSTIILAFMFLGLISASFFTVFQTDKVIILRLGKLQLGSDGKPKIYGPGLHFKVPFIDEVRNFDTRIIMLDQGFSRITTKEKKDVMVDFFVQWKIEDLAIFYIRNQGIVEKAKKLLQQKVVSGLKAEFGLRTIKEVVSGERAELMKKLRQSADKEAEHIGVSVLDVRIKRINLPDEVSESVYKRMRAERERAASEIIAEGKAQAIIISAEADKTKRILIADAEKDSQKIRGEGDAIALKTYADAYRQDVHFFEFSRSLQAYMNTFNGKDDVIVMKPDGDFFKHFKKSGNK